MADEGRRGVLSAAAGAAIVAFLGGADRAAASMADVERAVAAFGGGAGAEPDGALRLTLPEVAENGFSVPVSFGVDLPMTRERWVESVLIVAPENPVVQIATFRFTPASGLAEASTRLRLARTQEVLAFARTSDGTLHRASAHVTVVIGGCGA